MQTTRFKVFPKGYDPYLASCNSIEDLGEDCKQYTMKDILKAKKLEKQAKIIIVHKNEYGHWILPIDRWCEEIKA